MALNMDNHYSHAFLDFDGTLVDTLDCLFASYLEILNTYGISGTKAEFEHLNGPSIAEVSEYLKNKHKITNTTQTIYQRYKSIIRKRYINATPFADAEAFLQALQIKSIQISLITSATADLAGDLIQKLKWQHYFERVVYGDSVPNSKPNPAIYLKGLELANTKAENVIVIEDSCNGVRAAKDAGLTVFAVTSSHREEDLLFAGANKVFSSLSEITREK